MGEKQLGNGGKALDTENFLCSSFTGLQDTKPVLDEWTSGALWTAARGVC